MHRPNLGYLERVDLATLWKDEPPGFAPWFADPDRLAMLGRALRLRLSPVTGSLAAGPESIGLLCRDAGTGAAVAIEGRLGETDHAGLGALLSRAAEAGAPVAVWLAERFGPEHRAVLDSLNRRGRGTEGYFGVEMGLWRIDDSPVAPRFDVVAAPDGWRGPGPLTETGPRRYRHPCRVLVERSPVRTAAERARAVAFTRRT